MSVSGNRTDYGHTILSRGREAEIQNSTVSCCRFSCSNRARCSHSKIIYYSRVRSIPWYFFFAFCFSRTSVIIMPRLSNNPKPGCDDTRVSMNFMNFSDPSSLKLSKPNFGSNPNSSTPLTPAHERHAKIISAVPRPACL